jgi:hypothetical protein
MSNLEYGGYEVEAAEQEDEDLSKSGSSNFMKLNVGDNVVRILPPPVGRKSPFFTAFQHFLDLPGYDGPIVFNCPRMMARQFCPACAKSDKLRSSPSKQDQDAARDFWSSRRIYVNVIDRADEDAGPKILAIGKTIHEALVAIRKSDPDEGDFTHPETGFDINIQRQGTGKNDTKYKVVAARRSTALGDLDWINQQADLRAKLAVPSLDEIKAMFTKEEPQQMGSNVVGDAEALPAGGRARGRSAQDDVEAHGSSYRGRSRDFDDDDIPF